MKHFLIVTFFALVANAETKFLVNGKVSDPQAAAMAATDPKNTVLKCDQVVLKINSKGNMGLKKADTAGDWTTVKK